MINFILKKNSEKILKLGKDRIRKRLLISCKKIKKLCENLEAVLS